jgi:hypothetical protein
MEDILIESEKRSSGYIKHKWELILSKKLPFHYLLTIVSKQPQITVIIIVSPVCQSEDWLFMKPGSVSVRPSRD